MKDPIYNYEQQLLAKGDITENELSSMNQRVLEDVNSAFDFAENAPFPVEEFAYTGLYAINQ
jgi:pyruvate dehydrogenase E1 component alpha subunit